MAAIDPLDDAPADRLVNALGHKAAHGVKHGFGSWTYIILQTLIVMVWILWNSVHGHSFDPYPYILLNLAFSTQASYAAPLILIAQNHGEKRQEAIAAMRHAEVRADAAEIKALLLRKGDSA